MGGDTHARHNRIGRIVLAGTLLASLGFGSMALADQPMPTDAAGAAPASESAETVLAFKTVRVQGVQFQAATDLMEEAGDEGTGDTTYSYMSMSGMAEVSILAGDYTAMIDMIGADPTGYLTDGMGLEGVEVTGTYNRTLDGAPRWTLEFAFVEEGNPATGYLTILSSEDVSATVDRPVDGRRERQRGVGLRAARPQPCVRGRPRCGAECRGRRRAGARRRRHDRRRERGRGGRRRPRLPAGDSATFELPGWTLAVSTDPSTFVYATVSSWDDADGKSAIGVPVRITNAGTESESPWWGLTNLYYGPSGVQQGGTDISAAGWYFGDSFESVSSLRPGASTDAYLYFYDEGDGEYVAEFSAWDDNYDTVTEEIAFEMAR